jgi:hypothetical protein
MSVLAIVLIVLGALVLLFFVGGVLVARRRASRPEREEHIRRADQALEQARAADRGWDRDLIDAAARRGMAEHRPGFDPVALDLVLVDDRPGVEEDRAHLVCSDASGENVRVVLARDPSGEWGAERVE